MSTSAWRDYDMAELIQVLAAARGFREEATRARQLAGSTSGRLQGELHQIAAMYDKIADNGDPDHFVPPASRRANPPRLKQLARFRVAWP
jgi:hypothetical protein